MTVNSERMFRMKKLIIATLLTLPAAAFANNVGCGLGSSIWNGQKGIVPQVLAATTNGTSGNQTFGITSGTLGCTQDGVVTSSFKLAVFVDGNRLQLARDAAAGRGETLDALAALLQVRAEDKAAFVALTKTQHSTIFAKIETEQIAARLQAALRADARLAQYAAAV